MSTASSTLKYRPLLLAALAVIALPFAPASARPRRSTPAPWWWRLRSPRWGSTSASATPGSVSFGHGAWFGIGAYAAGLIQLHWFRGEICAAAAAVDGRRGRRVRPLVGFIILRRRGVYFSLLTLALAALTYTIAFRWTAVTGGEDGLGG